MNLTFIFFLVCTFFIKPNHSRIFKKQSASVLKDRYAPVDIDRNRKKSAFSLLESNFCRKLKRARSADLVK